MYGRADGIPSFPQSMVVCDRHLYYQNIYTYLLPDRLRLTLPFILSFKNRRPMISSDDWTKPKGFDPRQLEYDGTILWITTREHNTENMQSFCRTKSRAHHLTLQLKLDITCSVLARCQIRGNELLALLRFRSAIVN